MTPIFRTYFRLHCPLDCAAAGSVRTLGEALRSEPSTDVFVSLYEKRESTTLSAPYIRVDLAVEDDSYSISNIGYKIDRLFDFLLANETEIQKVKTQLGVNAILLLNINSYNDEQRPVFNLTNAQLKLLARLDCALEFDGYFLF